MKLTIDQMIRLLAIVDAWNAMREAKIRRATVHEVVEYMITQEEIGIEQMTKGDEAEAQPVLVAVVA